MAVVTAPSPAREYTTEAKSLARGCHRVTMRQGNDSQSLPMTKKTANVRENSDLKSVPEQSVRTPCHPCRRIVSSIQALRLGEFGLAMALFIPNLSGQSLHSRGDDPVHVFRLRLASGTTWCRSNNAEVGTPRRRGSAVFRQPRRTLGSGWTVRRKRDGAARRTGMRVRSVRW